MVDELYVNQNCLRGSHHGVNTFDSRNVWKILLEMSEYDRARSHCSGDPEKLDLISRRQANSLFERGE